MSTPEIEIVNYDKTVTSTRKQEEDGMFVEGAISMQDINEVIYMFPEEKDGEEVLRSAESRPRRDNSSAGKKTIGNDF